MARNLKTPPGEEPVTLAEAKAFLNVGDSSEDAWISQLIVAVRRACEMWTSRALVTQTWTWWLDRFPVTANREAPRSGYYQLPVDHFDQHTRQLDIPLPPLQSVTSITTYGRDHIGTVFPASNYFVDVESEPGRIVLNSAAFWPTGLREANAVEVEFVAGFGSAALVPDLLKQGMLLWIKLLYADKKWLFESGEPISGLLEFNRNALPAQVESLWSPYKIHTLKGVQ